MGWPSRLCSVKKHLDSVLGRTGRLALGGLLHSRVWSLQASSKQASKRCDVPVAAVVLSVACERALSDRLTTPLSLCTRLWRSLRKINHTIVLSSRDSSYLLPPTTTTVSFTLRYTPSAASRTALHPRSSQTEDAVHAMRNAPADPRSSLHINLPMRIAHTVDIQPTGSTALRRIHELT